MLLYTWMHTDKTFLNSYKFLLQFLVFVDKDFPLVLTHLHLRFPICILLVVGILRESDNAQDIRTHKFPTAKEVTDESATFQFQCATTCLRSNRFRIYAWRATHLPLLHTKTGFWVIQPQTKGMLLQITWSESWLLTWNKCCGQDSFMMCISLPWQCQHHRQQHIPQWHCYMLPLLAYHPSCFKFRYHLCWASQVTKKFGILTGIWTNSHKPLKVKMTMQSVLS